MYKSNICVYVCSSVVLILFLFTLKNLYFSMFYPQEVFSLFSFPCFLYAYIQCLYLEAFHWSIMEVTHRGQTTSLRTMAIQLIIFIVDVVFAIFDYYCCDFYLAPLFYILFSTDQWQRTKDNTGKPSEVCALAFMCPFVCVCLSVCI